MAAIEILALLLRIPGTRTVSVAMMLGLGAFGAGALVAMPAAALVALSFRKQRLARRLGALWWLLSAVIAGIVAHSQRVVLLGLARDHGWMRVTGLVGLLFVVLGLPASFLLRSDVLRQRRVLACGLAALLVLLIAAGLALGLEVFIRMQPPLHAFLGSGVAACVVLVRALLPDRRRPPWLAGVALAGGVALALPAIQSSHAVYAHAAHRGLLLSDVLHLVHPAEKPLPAVPVARVPASPGRPLAAQPRLVLLVTIDSLRYDITQSSSFPTLSALRARGRAHGPENHGRIHDRGRVQPHDRARRLAHRVAAHALPGRLRAQDRARASHGRHADARRRAGSAGLPDRGLRRDARAESRLGIVGGFEHLDLSIFEARNRDARGTPADLVRACALRMIEESSGAPLFLWLHYYDPHGPYSVHAGIDVDEDDPADRYRGEVLFVDRHLGALVRDVEQQVSRDAMILVVASDHGEELGEHGAAAHVYALYEETLRVPLLIAAPGVAPRRIDGPGSLADVAPTLVDLVGAAPLTGADGLSLAGAIRGDPLPQRPLLAQTVRLGRSQRAIIDGTYKLIYDSRFDTYELFDLARDPGEQWSLTDALPDVAAALATAMGAPPPSR